MIYEITPQVGYGPIKFGMSSTDVHNILGRPTKVETAVSESETDEEELKHYGNHHFEWFGKIFPDPTNPQLTFIHNKVAGVTIFKQSGSLVYMGMDLHKKKIRQDVLEVLAGDEEIYYENTRHYFFPKSGLIVPKVEHMKRFFFIQLVLTENQVPHLEFEMYEPSTALD